MQWRLGRRPALDGIRAVAVIAVLICHVNPAALPAGNLGVDAFFALSGFLITSLLIEELDDTGRVRLGRFWMRRALRLLPAVIALVAVVAALDPWMWENTRDGWWPTLLYYSDWYEAFDHFVGGLGHTWSLAVEEQFYIVWPIAVIGLWRIDKTWGAAQRITMLLAAVVVTRRIIDVHNDRVGLFRWYFAADYRADGVLIGAVLAFAYHRGRPEWFRHRAVPVAGAVAFGLAALGMLPTSSGEHTIVAVATIAVIVGICEQTTPLLSAGLSTPAMRWLGVRSYSLYLWHYPLVLAVHKQQRFPAWYWDLAAIVASIGLAALSYRFVESPFLRLKDRLRPVTDNHDTGTAGAAGVRVAPTTTTATAAPVSAVRCSATTAGLREGASTATAGAARTR